MKPIWIDPIVMSRFHHTGHSKNIFWNFLFASWCFSSVQNLITGHFSWNLGHHSRYPIRPFAMPWPKEGLNWFPLHDALFDFEYSTAKGKWPPTSVIFNYFLKILCFSIFKLSISIGFYSGLRILFCWWARIWLADSKYFGMVESADWLAPNMFGTNQVWEVNYGV